MKAVNLYFVTRPDSCEAMSKLYNELSCCDYTKQISPHEAASLKALVAELSDRPTAFSAKQSDSSEMTVQPDVDAFSSSAPLPLSLLDGFFFSYTIEHIGKEFDLLKLSKDTGTILNIELKSENVPEDRIHKQLSQNRYYLSHISRTIYSFTYVMETRMLYLMNDRGYLRQCPMS